MCWDFKFIVKNQNLSKCRIVAEFFTKPRFAHFFEVFRRIAQLGEEQELKEQKLEEEEEKERRGHRSQVECAPQEVGAYR